LKNIGLILFDIDGVIRSVENSYRLSLKKTVYKFSGWEPSYLDIDNAKNEGIWNNDWDLSLELIKRFIKKENLNLKIPPREEIVKCFEEFYFGGDPNKDSEFEFIEEDSNDLTSSYSEKDTLNLSRVIEKNRKIIKRYQAIVRTAVTLDALMDSENEENYKIK